MSSISQPSEEQNIQVPAQQNSVVKGNQSYSSVLVRLIGAELYKIRRRLMSKILSIIALVITVVFFCIISIGSFFVLASPAATFLPSPCSTTTPARVSCSNQSPTQTELQQVKLNALTTVSTPLRLPGSLNVAVQLISTVGLILIVILAGTIVGGEYSVGSIRLMFTRGPTRTQFLLAKLGAIIVCIILGVIVTIPVGLLTGALLNLIVGVGFDFNFFTANWFLHEILQVLIIMLGLFVFATIAVCLSTLGRTTAAGITGALIWWGLEAILGGVLILLGSQTTGTLADIVKAIPNYFIGNSINALSQNQNHYISPDAQAGAVPDWQALTVLAIYLIVFIGVAWRVNKKRDITN